jgi:putative flavoprotein involved in K+ transport
VRTKERDLSSAGIERVPRTAGVIDGKPALDDGRILDVDNVVWATGFHPDFSWIDLPVFDGDADPIEPDHERGVVADEPGLYFVGLHFLYALSSEIICGVGRDAAHVVDHIASRSEAGDSSRRRETPGVRA